MLNIERVLVPVYVAVAFIAAGTMISIALTPTVEVSAQSQHQVSTYSTKPLTNKLISELEATISRKLDRIDDEKLGKSAASTNADFVALRDAVTKAAKDARDLTTYLPLRQLNQSGTVFTEEYRVLLTKQTNNVKTERITKLEKAVATLEAAVPAENAAIEAAEAEAARIAAEQAESSGGGDGGYYGGDYSGGGDFESRIARIAGSLPFYLPYSIEGCPGGALACYTYTTHYIKITWNLSGYGDCTIRNAIAHEYRHYIQDISGMFAFDGNGQLTNRDWLESDAYAFGDQYGC